MMSVVHSLTLGVHVLAGVIALLVGLVAIVTTKGGRRHNAAGKMYVVAMSIVVVTAVPLAVVIESWFLLAIAVFTGYLVFAGVRVISRRRAQSDNVEFVDVFGHGLMSVAGAGMVIAGGVDTLIRISGLGPVLIVFGGVGIGLAFRELRTIRKPIHEQIPWFRRHIGFMGGAYIATVTASITVNLTMLPPLARWLGPTLIGVPLIIAATRKYEPRLNPSSRRTRKTPVGAGGSED